MFVKLQRGKDFCCVKLLEHFTIRHGDGYTCKHMPNWFTITKVPDLVIDETYGEFNINEVRIYAKAGLISFHVEKMQKPIRKYFEENIGK